MPGTLPAYKGGELGKQPSQPPPGPGLAMSCPPNTRLRQQLAQLEGLPGRGQQRRVLHIAVEEGGRPLRVPRKKKISMQRVHMCIARQPRKLFGRVQGGEGGG